MSSLFELVVLFVLRVFSCVVRFVFYVCLLVRFCDSLRVRCLCLFVFVVVRVLLSLFTVVCFVFVASLYRLLALLKFLVCVVLVLF